MLNALLLEYEWYLNFAEAWLWIAIGTCFLVSLIVRPSARAHKAVAALTFILFGISDFVEMHTKLWWHPWWLLTWKAACVIALFALLFNHWILAPKRNRKA